MSVIYIKDWIATNGALIAGVLATNRLEDPETLRWITNLYAEEPYITNFYVTNIVQTKWVTNTITMTNWSKFPVEHWYQDPTRLWLVFLLACSTMIIACLSFTTIRNLRGK